MPPREFLMPSHASGPPRVPMLECAMTPTMWPKSNSSRKTNSTAPQGQRYGERHEQPFSLFHSGLRDECEQLHADLANLSLCRAWPCCPRGHVKGVHVAYGALTRTEKLSQKDYGPTDSPPTPWRAASNIPTHPLPRLTRKTKS